MREIGTVLEHKCSYTALTKFGTVLVHKCSYTALMKFGTMLGHKCSCTALMKYYFKVSSWNVMILLNQRLKF